MTQSNDRLTARPTEPLVDVDRRAIVRRGGWGDVPEIAPYNPLSKENLGRSVEFALMQQPRHRLDAIEPFFGAGIYAIYYTGDFEPYVAIANTEIPIYVGRASASGSRKGGASPDEVGAELWSRLHKHGASIIAATNLTIDHFEARYLVADALFVPLAETLMIDGYRPVWNLKLDGFGNNDPGSGRYQQKRSPWDTMHPGRHWASKLKDSNESAAAYEQAAIEHILRTFPVAQTEQVSVPPSSDVPLENVSGDIGLNQDESDLGDQ